MTTALRPRIVADRLPIPAAAALAIVVRELGGVLLFPSQRYSVRVEIRSGSVAFTNYRIARDRLTGAWSCGCPGWVHCRKCYHLRDWVPYLEAALELQAVAIPPPAGVWY